MIGLGPGVRVVAYAAPVDLRKGYEAMCALVRGTLGHQVLYGDVYLFTGRCRRRAKVLYFDGTGLCLLCKRLEQGRFARLWSPQRAGPLELSVNELLLFLEGSAVVGTQPLSPPRLDPKILAVSQPI